MATRNCNAKEKVRHAAADLSALDVVLGWPPYTSGSRPHWRRVGQTPLQGCDTSGLQTELNRRGSKLK